MDWFTKIFLKREPTSIFTGIKLPTEAELAEFPKFSEVVGNPAAVTYRDLEKSKFPNWPGYNQFQTYQCVATTDCLTETILYFQRRGNEIKFSPSFKYDQRVNKPQGGMGGVDISRIAKNIGSIPFDLLPTPKTEIEANSVKIEPWMFDVAKVFQSSDDMILLPIRDFDTLVSVQQVTGKPIMVWFEFPASEWGFQPFLTKESPSIRHSVTFIPPRQAGENTVGLLPSGEPAIVIQDSALLGTAVDGKRIITKSWYEKRNIFAAYKMRFKFDILGGVIHWDGSIVSLQKCLQSLGFFPLNVPFVESVGPVTRSALSKYQSSRRIALTGRLDDITKAAIAKEF